MSPSPPPASVARAGESLPAGRRGVGNAGPPGTVGRRGSGGWAAGSRGCCLGRGDPRYPPRIPRLGCPRRRGWIRAAVSRLRPLGSRRREAEARSRGVPSSSPVGLGTSSPVPLVPVGMGLTAGGTAGPPGSTPELQPLASPRPLRSHPAAAAPGMPRSRGVPWLCNAQCM